jgi:BirA family biotin operon repressor/biotin-[acetyl-CoA-carboxylase] ligase
MIIGSHIIHHEKVSSTNTLALEMLRSGNPPEGTVITASFQESGKGQQGNTWVSELGKNLLMSVILYPVSISPGEQFVISQMVSLAVFDLVRAETPRVSIKWPNDIYVMNDKIAGILIENSVVGNSLVSSVAGIGLNVNQESFAGAGVNPVSLTQITGRKYNLPAVTDRLISLLDIRYKMILKGEAATLAEEYHQALFRLGESHRYADSEGPFTGMLVRVERDGLLVVRKSNGREKGYSFREIDYIL